MKFIIIWPFKNDDIYFFKYKLKYINLKIIIENIF